MLTTSMMLFGVHFTLIDVVGIIGVLMVLWAYCCIQLNRLSRDDLSFSLINFIGSCLILVSLFHTMNIASFVIEIAWFVISGYGIIRCLHHNRQMKKIGE